MVGGSRPFHCSRRLGPALGADVGDVIEFPSRGNSLFGLHRLLAAGAYDKRQGVCWFGAHLSPHILGRSEHPIYGGFSTRQKCDLSATHVFARQQPRYFISRSGQGTYHGGTTQLFSRIRPTEFRLPRGRTAGGASSRTNRRRPALAGTGLSRKGPRGSYRLRRASATCDSPRPQATFAGTRRQKLS